MTKEFSTLISNLEKRQLEPYYAENKEEAISLLLSLIEAERAKLGLEKDQLTISSGGSRTLAEIDAFSSLTDYSVLNAYAFPTPEEQYEAKRRAMLSDVFLMSANAICESGEIVNIDGNGNRLGAMIFGPRIVIMVVGKNKIVADRAAAMERIKTVACPKNAARLKRSTPCADGACRSCLIPGNTMCCHTVTTRFSSIPKRIKVILVNEELGF